MLACSADLLPAALRRLSMFVLRARCKLSDASAEVPLWGLAGTAADTDDAVAPGAKTLAPWQHRVRSGGEFVSLPPARVLGSDWPRALWAGTEPPACTPPAAPLTAELWRWLEVHSGVARIVEATAEQFVPQMVNLELVGGVDFQKGCYPGQEVVARSQYRGTIKRRSYVVSAADPLAPGMEIFDSSDPEQPAGRVVLAGSRGNDHAALLELKIAAVQGGSLHGGSPQGPLVRLADQPYALPVEAAQSLP